MEFVLIILLSVGLLVMVAAMVFWINRSEATRARDDDRAAWTALAARRDLRLVEPEPGRFELHGAANTAEFTVTRTPGGANPPWLIVKSHAARVTETEWLAFRTIERPALTGQATRKVPTGDAAFDAEYETLVDSGEAAPALLDERVRRALLALPSARLAYRAGSVELTFPREDLALSDDELDAVLTIVGSVCGPLTN